MATANINALDRATQVEVRFQELRRESALKKLHLWNFNAIDVTWLSWEILPPVNSLEVYKITPAIASNISRISSVRKLKLIYNEPTSVEIFSPLTRLTMLKTLQVYKLKPVEIAFIVSHLPQLSSLEVCSVTSEIFNHLPQLTQLKSLHMFTAKTLDTCSFAPLRALQKLEISYYSYVAPQALESLTHLTQLRLFKASLVYLECENGEKIGPANLFQVAGRLTRLEILNLGGNTACRDTDLTALLQLTDLRGLNLTHNFNLTENGLMLLTTLTALRVLNLQGCKLKNEALAPFLTHLQSDENDPPSLPTIVYPLKKIKKHIL